MLDLLKEEVFEGAKIPDTCVRVACLLLHADLAMKGVKGYFEQDLDEALKLTEAAREASQHGPPNTTRTRRTGCRQSAEDPNKLTENRPDKLRSACSLRSAGGSEVRAGRGVAPCVGRRAWLSVDRGLWC